MKAPDRHPGPEERGTMADAIKVERPDEAAVKRMGLRKWPIWEKEVSEFEWHFSENRSIQHR